MPEVSRSRLAELNAESTLEDRQYIALLSGFKAYQNRTDFLANLKGSAQKMSRGKAGKGAKKTTAAGTRREVVERAGFSADQALRRLEELGVVESGSRRDGTATVRVVDLYAFAQELGIKRVGRR